MEVTTSVRNLVEFILRTGDIDNRKTVQSTEDVMLEGSRIHRMIQKSMGPDYHAEVYMKYIWDVGEYSIMVEGRADGVVDHLWEMRDELRNEYESMKRQKDVASDIHEEPKQQLLQVEGLEMEVELFSEEETGLPDTALRMVVIDEIKTTHRDLDKMKGPVPLHVAQAKCYAFMYADLEHLDQIRVRMTYCNRETEDIRYFYENYTYEELHAWFFDLLKTYKKWSDYSFKWNRLRQYSIKNLEFPYPYREGQKELASGVYSTIYRKKKLFIEAPTGTGKTITTTFPAVKAIGEGLSDKIFYLTAKTITRTVAEEAFSHMREKGLQFKTVILTAKDKVCFLEEEPSCNPEDCPYAKGHFDRINDAIYDMLTHESAFTRELIEEYAIKYQVCPFEFCLDMSLFADGVICDYNYVFDPHVYLRRFFGEGTLKKDYIFLVDEAHNLLDRGREMYSAVLKKDSFLALKKTVRVYNKNMASALEQCNRQMLLMKRECEKVLVLDTIDPLVMKLNKLSNIMWDYLEEHYDSPVRTEVLELYFEVQHFLLMEQLMDDKYVIYSQMEDDGDFSVKLFCVDPSNNLKACMGRGRSTVLFSATLLPIQYYKGLLGGTEEDYEMYAHSIFDSSKRGLFIGNDVTSKYTRRGPDEYRKVARYIDHIVKGKAGNYLIFFPSHAFLKNVYECFQSEFFQADLQYCLVQEEYMKEEEREAFLEAFEEEQKAGHSLLGFCVMGGIFSEGIDLKHDSLIGAIVVGTGLPQVCNEREIMKNYFDEAGWNGFEYAYQYPGMNKVLQAAGRVIRTEEDRGIVALLDERFLQKQYTRMFPAEWDNMEVVDYTDVQAAIEIFWNAEEEET